MKRRTGILSTILAAGMMLLLIVDTQTAKAGTAKGIEMCIKVLIPSLFPFFIVTTYLNASLTSLQIPVLRTIGRFLHIPVGCESIFMLGSIGGYPIGAQLIAESYTSNKISKRNAQILLGYCSNAGPAFIFGVTSTLFSSVWVSLLLWVIQIFSAMITAVLLPNPEDSSVLLHKGSNISMVKALRKSISACVSVCGWVIMFKIIMSYLECLINDTCMIYLTGFLELSNGCLLLNQVVNESARLILCSAFLSFGGACVLMQTFSVTESLGLGLYIPGKIIQTSVSVVTAIFISLFLFPDAAPSLQKLFLCCPPIIPIIILAKKYTEKNCGNTSKNHV